MEDRIPTPGQEGRVLITPESGSPYYAKIEMADNPTQVGTPLNKETLLQDSTEIEIFGNAENRTVDEAFVGVMGKISLIMENVATMTLTVTDTTGVPMTDVYVNGIFDDNGETLATNSSGQISGYVSEGNTTFSVTGYADIVDFSEQFEVVKGQSYTHTIQVTTRNFLKMTSTQNVRFSGNVEQVDVNVVGAGGGGYGVNGTGIFTGGGGGYCVISENVSFTPNEWYSAVIGAGGNGGYGPSSTAAGKGGTSSFLGVSAEGGNGGSGDTNGGKGNGNGGYATSRMYGSIVNATPGTVAGYSSFTETTVYGGGGSGGFGWINSGEYMSQESSSAASAAGGGGGRGNNDRTGGAGVAGCIAIRMHLKSAA